MLVTRKTQHMTIDSTVTVGIASELISVDRITLRKWADKGLIPSNPITYDEDSKKGAVDTYRVRDLIYLAIRKNLPIEFSMLGNVDLSGFDRIKRLQIPAVYLWHDPDYLQMLPENNIKPIRTWELFKLLEIDPFAIYAFMRDPQGDYIAKEVLQSTGRYRPRLWAIGKEGSYHIFEMIFKNLESMVKYVEAENAKPRIGV